jgi:hypothetical protein
MHGGYVKILCEKGYGEKHMQMTLYIQRSIRDAFVFN